MSKGTGVIYGKQIVKNTIVKKLNGSSESDQFLISDTDNNVVLDINSIGSTHSFDLRWTGTLPVNRGGLNNTELNGNEILIAESDGNSVISSGYVLNDNGVSQTDIWSADKIIAYQNNFRVTKVEFTIGDGIQTDFLLDHNLGTKFVIIQIFDQENGEEVDAYIKRVDNNNALISFNKPPLTDEYCVVII